VESKVGDLIKVFGPFQPFFQPLFSHTAGEGNHASHQKNNDEKKKWRRKIRD